ncbi:MAG TPA: cytochrome C oxidase subunit IV family protein [Bacteroidia bacterium]|nr:cytochrome C oxidase subunit IV family protein [Bacteroidia bacterium]
MEDKQGIVFADPKTDYHGHPNYGKVFLLLLAFLGLSLLVGYLVSPLAAVYLIFATALIKVALVVRNFMHLKYESWIIWVTMAAVVFVLLVFFFALFPDITEVTRVITK